MIHNCFFVYFFVFLQSMKKIISLLLILITTQNISYSNETKTFIKDTINVEATKYNSIYPVDVINIEATETEKNSIRNLNGLLGGVFISDYGSSISGNIYYRGFGNRFNGSGVTLFIDGIPMLVGTETSALLFNINEIAIGQQNINHSGLSAIDISTKSAINEETDIMVEYENYNTFGGFIKHNRRLNDKLYLGIYGRGNYSKGWEKNEHIFVTSNRKGDFVDANVEKNYGAGLRLEGEISKNVFSLTKIDFSSIDEGGFNYRRMEDGVLLPLLLNCSTNNYKNTLLMISEKLDVKLTEKLYLLSLTSYSYLKNEMFLDQDFSEENIFNLNQKQNRHRVTQEIRFHINNRENFNYTIGFFGSFEQNNPYTADVNFWREGIEKMIENNITSNIPTFVSYKILDSNFMIPNYFTDRKLFASSYYNFIFNNLLVDNFSFEGTLKFDYFDNKLDYDVSSFLTQFYTITQMGMTITDNVKAEYTAEGTTTNNYFRFSPKVLFLYKVNPKNNLFGSFVKGYKNGGYNIQMLSDVVQNNLRTKMIDELKESISGKLTDAGMPPAAISGMLSRFPTFNYFDGNIGDVLYYKPEESYSFELGYNTKFSNFDLAAKLFFITINQLQLTQFSPNGFGRMLLNVGEANSKGGEINITYRPINELTVKLNYNFADALFTKYFDTTITDNKDTIVIDHSNNRIPYTPNHLFNFSTTYTHKFHNKFVSSIYGTAEYSGSAGIYWNESNSLSQDYYGTINAKIGVSFEDNFTIEFYGKNISNEKYYTFYFESLSKDFYQLARPFQFGVKLNYKI